MDFRAPTLFPGDGAPATSLPWIFRLHPKRPSDSPGTTSDHPLLARRPPTPTPTFIFWVAGLCAGDWERGDVSPVSAARRLLLATPRAVHDEARVFIALRCAYAHFGTGSKPAGLRPKNAIDSTESFPEAGAGRVCGDAGGGGRRGALRHLERLGRRQTLDAGSHPEDSELGHGASRRESLN